MEPESNFGTKQMSSLNEVVECKEEATPEKFTFIKIEAKVRCIPFPFQFLFLFNADHVFLL